MTQVEHGRVASVTGAQCDDNEAMAVAVGAYVLGRLTLHEASILSGISEAELAHAVSDRAATVSLDVRTPGLGTPRLSFVVPVYDEEANLEALYTKIAGAVDVPGDFEIVFVDDGSRDRSLQILIELHARDPRVKVIRLSRNFGHQAALSAGLAHARGEAVVFMDADLQDPPEVVLELVRQWEDGHKVVHAVRRTRQEGPLKRLAYRIFYRVFSRLADIDIALDSGDFALIDRQVADAILALPERNRFLRGLRSWVGFEHVTVPYDRPGRHAGSTKYSLGRLVRLALDGIVAFSSRPLQLSSYLGFLTAAAGVVYIMFAVAARLFLGAVPEGWTSLIAIVLTVGGIQLIMMGIVGEYLARVYDEAKARPPYVIAEYHGIEPR